MSSDKPNIDPVIAGRQVLEVEQRALSALIPRLGPAFAEACQLCLATEGRVVVTGMGKSGHIAGKIAATLASTGTPAFFVHPGEASHGDLGMITRHDTVFAISYSGESQEITTILPLIKRLGIALIAITGKADSTLGKAADVHLDGSVAEEACPLNLAPTASTTAALALGDALAVALLEARGFTPEDFARSHPGGSLGRRLVLTVADVMRSDEAVPRVSPTTRFLDALLEMNAKGMGMTAIVDDEQRVKGIFTDGDLRRALDVEQDLRDLTMADVMVEGCRTITAEVLATEAVHAMEAHRITSLLVTDASGTLTGALNVHDLLRAGVM